MERQAVPTSVEMIAPHGGELKRLYVSDVDRAVLSQSASVMPSWDLTPRQLCDVEMLLNGSFSPLQGYMCRADYDSVLERMRLADGTLWSIPIVLDVSEKFAEALSRGQCLALRDPEGVLIAVLEVDDIWFPSPHKDAQILAGTGTVPVPVLERRLPVYLGGPLFGIQAPVHYDFPQLRETPQQVRKRLAHWGRRHVVAFQAHHLPHRAQVEMTRRAAAELDASLLIQPILDMSRPGGDEHFPRVRCHEHVITHYPARTATLNLLPLTLCASHERELIHQAVVARNFGSSHFLLGADKQGEEGSRELLQEYREELAVEVVESKDSNVTSTHHPGVSHGLTNLSEAEVVRRLRTGQAIPDSYTYPEILEELRHMYPPRHEQGFAIFFTGLSGSGKSTLANAVRCKLLESDRRQITLLDGDHVRKHLSSELGFSKEHRDLNVLRIGFVASEIAKHGGIAICAPIAPYAEIRYRVRQMIESVGGFVEVHVATSLEVCEGRDRKGLYAKARAGLLKGFTGIDDPYEVPVAPELSIDTAGCSPDEAAGRVLQTLAKLGYVRQSSDKFGEPAAGVAFGQPSRNAVPHSMKAQWAGEPAASRT